MATEMAGIGRRTIGFALLLLFLLSAVHLTASAADVGWVRVAADGEGAWSDAANWDPTVGVPTAEFEDTALINNGGTAAVATAVGDVTGLQVYNGTLNVQAGGSLTVVEHSSIGGSSDVVGRLLMTGDGTFHTGSLTNGSRMEWVGSEVSMSVDGDFTNQRTATIALDLSAGGNPVMSVGGTAQLAGTVLVNIAPEVDLSFGNSWPFIQSDSITGQAAVVATDTSPSLPRGLDLQVQTGGGNASIVVGNLPVLTLDRATGAAQIRNIVGGPLSMKSYSLGSATSLLNPTGWTSLQSQQLAGWLEANPQEQLISELNLEGEATLGVGDVLDLGNAYAFVAGASPRDEDVTFSFSTPDGRILEGLVEYTGPANDLVLRVDPETGEAAIRNLSAVVDPFDVTGYSILSAGEGLTPETWNSFTDSGAAGEGWIEANPQAASLAELNVANSHVFSNGTDISLGSIFAPGSEQDLVFEFSTLLGELRVGTVEYGSLTGGNMWDCNGDGTVTVFDADCTAAGQIDEFLAANGFIKGDADGSGDVQFPDFVILADNFGNAGQYTDGDFDKSGDVQFPDFVILANNFGQSAAAGVAAVPEPTTGVLSLIGFLALGAFRRRQRRNTNGPLSSGRARFMTLTPRIALVALTTAVIHSAAHAPAVSQEILGVGTEFLLGGDLTDPENDGDPEADVNYNAGFRSNNEPGFAGGEFSYNVFDNEVGGGNMKWCCGPAGGIPEGGLWIEAALEGRATLTHFTVSSANDTPERDPIHWLIEGSNDGVNYTTIYEYDGTFNIPGGGGPSPWTARNQVALFSAPSDFPEQDVAYQIFRFNTLDTVFNLTDPRPGAYFQVAEIEFFGDLVALSAGDFNEDGSIDMADLGIMAANFNEDGKSFSEGDMNSDFRVDLADFIAFRDIYPQQNLAAVPEPSTGVMAVMGMVAAWGCGRPRRPVPDASRRAANRRFQTARQIVSAMLVVCLVGHVMLGPANAEIVLGTGTESLLGSDLTDPENDGDPEADSNYNAFFDANDEPGFAGGESAFNVFDNQVGGGNMKWCCGAAGGVPEEGLWVEADLDVGPVYLTHFTVSSANDTPGRDPSHWMLQGSNNFIDYTTIYEHNGASLWTARNQVIQFNNVSDFPAQDTAYQIYRFTTLDTRLNPAGAYFQFSELELFGETTQSTPGDFNSDGNVDFADLTLLAENFGTGTTFAQGDINRDQRINLQDFVHFSNAFNGGQEAMAVPEPSGLVLSGMALLLLVRRRRPVFSPSL